MPTTNQLKCRVLIQLENGLPVLEIGSTWRVTKRSYDAHDIGNIAYIQLEPADEELPPEADNENVLGDEWSQFLATEGKVRRAIARAIQLARNTYEIDDVLPYIANVYKQPDASFFLLQHKILEQIVLGELREREVLEASNENPALKTEEFVSE